MEEDFLCEVYSFGNEFVFLININECEEIKECDEKKIIELEKQENFLTNIILENLDKKLKYKIFFRDIENYHYCVFFIMYEIEKIYYFSSKENNLVFNDNEKYYFEILKIYENLLKNRRRTVKIPNGYYGATLH